jgi:glutamine synthetase
MPNALELAEKLYVNVNIFAEENKAKLDTLSALPASCYDSAIALENKRTMFEANGIFPTGLIDSVVAKLKAYNDQKLSEELYGKNDEIAKLVKQYLHCM